MISFLILVEYISTAFGILSSFGLLAMIFVLLSTEKRAPHIRQGIEKRISSANSKSANLSFLSIIVSARNEEEKIGRCISSLISQTYKNFEIIVVDDNSTDKTFEIASEFESQDSRVHLVKAGTKPDGWVGKSWPCMQGFEISKGDLLLFVDADSTFESDAAKICVEYFQDNALDMFSISPLADLEGPWSKSTLPLVSGGINLLYPMEKVNDQKSERAYVFGTFVLVRRSVYTEIGGHESVRSRIVEDAAIAQQAKSKGYKLRVVVGDGLAHTDWESDFKSVYHGLERVFSDSVRSYGLVSLLNAIVIFFIGLYPILYVLALLVYSGISNVDQLFQSNFNSLVLTAGFTACILCILLSISLFSNELKLVSGKIGTTPVLYPLGFALFMSAIITSTLKISRAKGLHWKGQEYKQDLVISK